MTPLLPPTRLMMMTKEIHEEHDGSQCTRQVQEATMQREGHHRVTAATATAGGQLGRWNWQRHVEIDRRVSSRRPWFMVVEGRCRWSIKDKVAV